MDAAKGSRLEKLLHLLEGGESVGIRDTAARQIATLAQAHPSQICSILRRVHKTLHSRRWEGRVAAGTCLSLLAEHFKHSSAGDLAAGGALPLQPDALEASCSADAQGHLRFSSFDVANLLRDGRVLLQSGGQEFQEDDRSMSSAERLQAQRKALNKRLKLTPQLESIMDTGELVDDEDLVAKSAPAQAAKKQGQSADEMLSQMSGLSARERNQLKRKLKQSSKASAGAKRVKESLPAAQDVAEDAVSEDAEWQAVAGGQWPFQHLADQLLVDCLSPSWEVRHGVTLALRDILSSQASSAAVLAPVSQTPSGWAAAEGSGRLQLQGRSIEAAQKAQVANALWVEDCVVHLLTVLALDRFGDYGSDQVVAPVRETAAQALGAASRALSGPKVAQVAELLCSLAAVDDWSVRHGGLLGLKYLLAARQDRADSLLQAAVPAALRGLQDSEDDVRAVAAEALLPVGPQLALRGGSDSLTATIETRLWDILLLDSGDLNLSTGSAMRLLACLYTNGHKGQYGKLEPLLPRLWPFFRHTLAAVRLAVVQCLKSLLALAEGAVPWLTPPILTRLLQLAFQNLLLETDGGVLQASKEVWAGALQRSAASALGQPSLAQAVPDLFGLAATVEGWAFDQRKLQALSAAPGGAASGLPRPEVKAGDSGDALSMRFAAAEALGQLGALWTPGRPCPVAAGIETHLASDSAAGRLLAALTAKSWVLHPSAAGSGQQQRQGTALPAAAISALQKALLQPKSDRTPDGQLLMYAELGHMYQHTHNAAARLLALCGAKGQDLRGLLAGLPPQQYAAMLTAENAKELATTLSSQDLEVAEAAQLLLATAEALLDAENLLHISVTAMMAAALAQAGSMPPKLNGVIQPLMAALRRQASPQLRRAAAAGLAALILLTAKQNKKLATKVVDNVAGMVCGDPSETPRASDPDPEELGPEQGLKSKSSGKAKAAPQPEADEAATLLSTARQGGQAAVAAIAERFGARVLDDLPVLAEKLRACLSAGQTADAAETQAVLDSLQLLRVLGPALAPALQPQLLAWLPQVMAWLRHHRSIVRTSASKAVAALTGASPDALLPVLLRQLVPMLGSGEGQAGRQGAIELVERLVNTLREAMVPYLLLLVMPVMGCMADQDSSTRVAATAAFGRIVALLPLAQGLQPPDTLTAGQREAWLRDADFLQELLDNSKVRPAELPAAIMASLRPYQQEGLNWLAFLRRCGLHGILADDMGLGKTLQATATLTAAHQQARQAGQAERPSLVVCPQVLVGHWTFEIGKFVRAEALRPLAYEGGPQARAGLRAGAAQADVVIMSYETLRADVEWVAKQAWRYCILDEGHIIRNPKAKIAEACKRVTAEHRLILTGTPIQNSVNELWALFDFLMPGFLGSEAEFNAKYGRAYRSGRASSVGSREAQAAFVAMEGLHKQVMPFVLRRQKDAVLADLPPKIVQDVYCRMSPLQAELYDQFSSSTASQSVHSVLAARAAGQHAAGSEARDAPHVFQALQYMRRLCSHPLMVLQASLPHHVSAALGATGASSWEQAEARLHDVAHAPKLGALLQLLQQCSIVDGGSPGEAPPGAGLGLEGREYAHRVLVFAQFKLMLDLVERDVLAPAGVPFLRLDGSVEASRRFSVVRQFNSDPSIPVMLLTTSVGGLGLNLTAADTVIFLEHDWNPMKDLQAMDRAHRLGQSRTVNVYRLLVKDSMEERVMSLQQFKTDVANAVINQDNVSLTKMDTSKLLDIWRQPAGGATAARQQEPLAGANLAGVSGGLKSLLEGLEDLWDQSQYAEEFSLDTFAKKMS